MKINLLYIIDNLGNGGKERQLIEICKNIDKSKININIISFGAGQHYEKEAIKHSSNYLYIDKERNKIAPFFKLFKFFRQNNIDIVHSWDDFSAFYIYLLSFFFSYKTVGSIRNAGGDKNVRYYLKQYLLKRSNVVISNTYAGLRFYNLEGTVLKNLINTERFETSTHSTEFNIIKASSFTFRKNHKMFFEAAIDLVRDDIVDIVYLAGDGPFKNQYEQIINNYDNSIKSRFVFLGAVHNVEKIYKNCKIGILCSTAEFGEGLSNTLLEYMAAGLVPIATNIGGSLEIINHNQNGFLVNENDSKMIYECVKLLHEDEALYNRISEKAKETIENDFDKNLIIEKLLTLYFELKK